MSRVDSISGEVFFRGVTAVEHVSEGNRVRLLEGGEEGPEFVVVGRESEGKWFGGIFTPASFRNPSPEQFNGVFLTQPFDQSVMSQSAGDFGTNPFKQPHTGEL
uniref:Uncharacterized protein n=1 Tax=Salix viminalis TaxID=40686 RepID=A0A6N2MAL1_SALVM